MEQGCQLNMLGFAEEDTAEKQDFRNTALQDLEEP